MKPVTFKKMKREMQTRSPGGGREPSPGRVPPMKTVQPKTRVGEHRLHQKMRGK